MPSGTMPEGDSSVSAVLGALGVTGIGVEEVLKGIWQYLGLQGLQRAQSGNPYF